MFHNLKKAVGQVGAISATVVGVLLIVIITNLMPTIAAGILGGKNAVSNVNNVNNETAAALNSTLDTILPTYAITPLAVVVGIILLVLAYAGTRD